jgi:aldose 1-epimerase
MTPSVRSESRELAGGHVPVVILSDPSHHAHAEVWPTVGFNALRWQVGALGLLDVAPDFGDNPVPTRSGTPILFPFPNRIRDGRFSWDGKEYQLPRLDSTKQNAIHGFAVRAPWRVTGQGADRNGAHVTGEFRLAQDAPQYRDLWPADCQLSVTVRLSGWTLALDLTVSNPDARPLPWGLGLHPYFLVPPDAPEAWLEVPARAAWELTDSLPTGKRLSPPPHDLGRARLVSELTLDDLYTDLYDETLPEHGLHLRGRFGHGPGRGFLELWASPFFRELLAFTPPHRRSVCLEPYTCATDAVNLQPRGQDAGWQVLPPGGTWRGRVEFRWVGAAG